MAAALQCGIVSIDDHHRLDPASPCGGVKLSGVGREFGPESFNDHFEVKSVMVNMSDQPFDWYGETAQQAVPNTRPAARTKLAVSSRAPIDQVIARS